MRLKRYNKYHNSKNKDGDSKKERRRKAELQMLEKAGAIKDLQCQVKFELIPKQELLRPKFENGRKVKSERAVSYIADFTYIKDNKLIVEDVKSPVTRALPLYIVKRKLMLYIHGIQIYEV